MNMYRFLLRRTLGSIAVLLIVTFMSYVLIFIAPGDPAAILIGKQTGRYPTQAQITLFRAVQGNLGESMRTGKLVISEVGDRFGNTLLLVTATMFVAILFGIPGGLLAAWFKNTFLDRLIHALSMLAVAIPDFWLAFLLLLIFSINLRWLPSHGMGSVNNLILPVICLGLANIARLNRLTRSGLMSVEREKYLLSARAKGLDRRTAWIRHGFPNIAVPIVTLIFTLFSGAIALYGAVFILGNILADIATVIIDPRIRLD
jgi:peptide/nickel transport system permease protein